MSERLQKLMAQAGFGSRRECEGYIEAGRVRVNGKVAKLGDQAEPGKDTITVDGETLRLQPYVYIMLNKPKGVLSSTEDELNKDRPTVRDLVDVPGHLYPVGRLDRQSRGLVLLTNDGDLAHKLTHPSYGHEKIYRVVVEGHPTVETVESWQNGVYLDNKKTLPCTIDFIESDKTTTKLKITMREGRKRQIRRVASQLGHPVKQLTRLQIGTLKLADLGMGQWRELTDSELKALKRSVAQRTRRKPRAADKKRQRPDTAGPERRSRPSRPEKSERGRRPSSNSRTNKGRS
ncbi:MAG: rRNA pseudouridine synthase [Anaerolineales bacterium]|nr:rRNA pseudouridine synthase [Anaerolineales bacterium]MCB0028683.1 rRNA pseudouridine synthase [Anaerolineales bacterium]